MGHTDKERAVSKVGTVRVDIVWPEEATRNDWRIKDVIAIDEDGNAHKMQIIGASRDIVLRPKPCSPHLKDFHFSTPEGYVSRTATKFIACAAGTTLLRALGPHTTQRSSKLCLLLAMVWTRMPLPYLLSI